MSDFFAKPIFHGPRFDGHTLPVDALKELQAYQEAVIQLAATAWRAEHPDRLRLPALFESSFRLTIMGLDREAGCTGVLLAVLLNSGEQEAMPHAEPPNLAFFERGRDMLSDLASSTKSSWPRLPARAKKALRKLGEGLYPGEYVLLGASMAADSGPRLNHDFGHRFANSVNFDDNVVVVGMFDSRSVRSHTIGLIVDGRNVVCRVPEGDVSQWNNYLDHRVRVEGIGMVNDDDEVLEVSVVHRLTLAEPAKISAQIDRLRRLNDGWDGAESRAPDRALLARFESLLVELEELNLPRPSLYGTDEGGARAEWTRAQWEVALVANPDDDAAYGVEILNRATHEWIDEIVDADMIGEKLHAFLGDEDAG